MWHVIYPGALKPGMYETCIIENEDLRMQQTLYWDGRLWWTRDRTMYIYYEPTHYRRI